jgi:hypothetical protein
LLQLDLNASARCSRVKIHLSAERVRPRAPRKRIVPPPSPEPESSNLPGEDCGNCWRK